MSMYRQTQHRDFYDELGAHYAAHKAAAVLELNGITSVDALRALLDHLGRDKFTTYITNLKRPGGGDGIGKRGLGAIAHALNVTLRHPLA